jgi:hypothetical protein
MNDSFPFTNRPPVNVQERAGPNMLGAPSPTVCRQLVRWTQSFLRVAKRTGSPDHFGYILYDLRPSHTFLQKHDATGVDEHDGKDNSIVSVLTTPCPGCLVV